MASVKLVYETLKDLVNKDQQGFVTPSVFNNFAQIAQLRIFNRMFGSLKDAQAALKSGLDRGRDKSRMKQIEEDLAYFSKTESKSRNTTLNAFEKPEDLARIISITTSGDILLSSSTRRPVELVYDEDKIERILLSNISKPTEAFPVAMIGDNIEVYPEAVKKIRIRYYKIPEGRSTTTGERTASQPQYGYTEANGIEVYSSGNSVDFELPEHYLNELVIEIAELAGLNLRDNAVSGYSGQEQMQIKSEK